MHKMMKSLYSAFLIAIIVGMFSLVGTLHFSMVQASVDVTGIITSNTTWTKANSPYSLKGPVAVDSGVTLTVEAGVTVNLNGYYIQVNGTLVARGSSTDKINFNDGSIVFTSISKSWNEQTGSGCIIENSVLSNASVSINDVSPKINRNSIYGVTINGGSPVISYNTITGGVQANEGSPSISYNDITSTVPGSTGVDGGSPLISHNTINCRIIVTKGNPVVSNNKIADGIHADSRWGQIVVNNNEINMRNTFIVIYIQGIHAEVSNNKIIGNGNAGIKVFGSLSSASISDNAISDCSSGIDVNAGGTTTIVRNLIFNNEVGVSFEGNITVQDNTITGNSVGIQCNPSQSSTITNNNIQDNSQYNFRSETANDIIATNNWWGTTDSSSINQTIYDNKYDFNLGTVTFIPFLTAPNPEAPPIPTPTPTPSATPTSTPTQSPSSSPSPSQNPTASPAIPQIGLNEIEIAILVVLIVIVVLLVVIIGLVLRKGR
jgi:parallel beta-helix repeat protein